MERVLALEPAYARARQRLLARGSSPADECWEQPVDEARQRAAALLKAWRADRGVERDAIGAHNALARLMESVIDEGRRRVG
jgi:hypothetical protein